MRSSPTALNQRRQPPERRINPPEVGILAVGTAEDHPVIVKGELQTRKRVRVTMSCDHRAVDGAVGARFLVTLRRLIENPLMLVY